MTVNNTVRKYALLMLLTVAAFVLAGFDFHEPAPEAAYSQSAEYYAVNVGGETVANVATLEEGERIINGVKSYYAVSKNTIIRASVDPAVYIRRVTYDPQIDRAPVLAEDVDAVIEDIIASGVIVTTEQDAVSEKTVPFETVYAESSSMYTDESKVTTEGSDGRKIATDRVVTVNGKQVSSKEIKSEIIEEPVNRVLTKWTAVRAYSSMPGYFSWPCSGTITSYFGYRDDVPQYGYNHTGIDISVSSGTPIYAAADGTVESSTGWSSSYGYVVFIDHGNGYETLYAHNSQIVVAPGQTVTKGQVIAYAGSTGNATGPHCHFAVIVNGSFQNPLNSL